MVSTLIDKVLRISQIDYSAFSGHDLIFCCFDYNVVTTPKKSYQFRNYNRFTVSDLNNAIDNVNWSPFFISVDPNEMIDFFPSLDLVFGVLRPILMKKNNFLTQDLF